MSFNFFKRIRRRIFPNQHEKIVKIWHRDHGEDMLKFSFNNLNSYSIILDVGGFKGDWSSEIFSRYGSKIHIFEPVKQNINYIENRFKNNKNIFIHSFGLGNKNAAIQISLDGVSSSVYRKTKESEKIQIVDIVSWLEENKIGYIDLIKLNVEGAEYDIIERLIDRNWIEKINCFLIQFHDINDTSSNRMKKIKEFISLTHNQKFEYEFVWEKWEKRN